MSPTPFLPAQLVLWCIHFLRHRV